MVRRWIYPLIGKSARKVPPMNKCCIIGDPVLTQKCQPINWSEDGLVLEQIVENLRAVLCSQTVKHPTWRIMLSRMVGRLLPSPPFYFVHCYLMNQALPFLVFVSFSQIISS